MATASKGSRVNQQTPEQRMGYTNDDATQMLKNMTQMFDARNRLQVDQNPQRSRLDKEKNPKNGSRYD